MIKHIFSGGVLNLISFFFTFITSFIVVRILEPNEIIDYYRFIALVSWGSLAMIAVNNYGIIMVSAENSTFNKVYILLIQLVFSLIYFCVLRWFWPESPLILFIFSLLNFISLEWVFIAENRPAVLITGNSVNRIFVLIVLLFVYTNNIDIRAADLIQVLVFGFALNFVILLSKSNITDYKVDLGSFREIIVFVGKTVPFYLLHGQIFNYVLMFYPFKEQDAGLVIYSRLVVIAVGFVTSLSHFTMPIFNNSRDNSGIFWKGLIITLSTSSLIVILLLFFHKPVEYIFLDENVVGPIHRIIFSAVIIFYPIYNYFVVNHYIVKKVTNKLLIPLLLLILPIIVMDKLKLDAIAPYMWIAFCFCILSLVFLYNRKRSMADWIKSFY